LHSTLPSPRPLSASFFPTHTSPTALYTLSLHDALPIFTARAPATAPPTRPARAWPEGSCRVPPRTCRRPRPPARAAAHRRAGGRSEEHTSELQSLAYLVCRLLLEKKKHLKVLIIAMRPR